MVDDLFCFFFYFLFHRSHPRSASASPHRPVSAKAVMTPSPPSSERRPSAKLRPASAKITHSSYKDYLVSNACRDIPTSPSQVPRIYTAGETRTSQLRRAMSRDKSDWMLQETQDYLDKKPNDFKQRVRKVKGKQANNPLRTNSDQCQISLCNMNAFAVIQDMRMKDMITQQEFR